MQIRGGNVTTFIKHWAVQSNTFQKYVFVLDPILVNFVMCFYSDILVLMTKQVCCVLYMFVLVHYFWSVSSVRHTKQYQSDLCMR